MIQWFSPHEIEAERLRRLYAEAEEREKNSRAELKLLEADATKRYQHRMRLARVNKLSKTISKKPLQ